MYSVAKDLSLALAFTATPAATRSSVLGGASFLQQYVCVGVCV